MSHYYCNCRACADDLADLRARLAAAEARELALREAVRIIWLAVPCERRSSYTTPREGCDCWRCLEVGVPARAALAQPHRVEALRDFGLRVVAETTRGCSHDCYRRESDAEVVDAVLKGER